MKFIVNVKLVEKSVKSHVGSVIDVKVISQYSTPGMTRTVNSSRRPHRLRNELDGFPPGAVANAEVCAFAEMVARLTRELSVSDMVVELPVTIGPRSWSSIAY